MTARMNITQVAPDAFRALQSLQQAIDASGVDPRLLELVRVRASQVNGCAFCLDMHTKDARALGETEQRLYLLAGWREAPVFTPEERAALALTDAVTQIGQAGVPDDVWAAAAGAFGTTKVGALLVAISAVNAWNRLAIATHAPAGHYVSRYAAAR